MLQEFTRDFIFSSPFLFRFVEHEENGFVVQNIAFSSRQTTLQPFYNLGQSPKFAFHQVEQPIIIVEDFLQKRQSLFGRLFLASCNVSLKWQVPTIFVSVCNRQCYLLGAIVLAFITAFSMISKASSFFY